MTTYPSINEPAIVISWSKSELGNDWEPPACTGWQEVGFSKLVSIAARFSHTSGVDGFLIKIGSVSQLKGVAYWSTTHKQWKPLITDAYALDDAHSAQHRQDFTPDELRHNRKLFFEQVDNLSGKAVYQMRLLAVSNNRIVFEIENATDIRYHFVPLFRPGDLQSVYFFERESDQVWRYYSIARVSRNANMLLIGNDRSFINRAVAFYRYFVGIPSTQEPPAAR